LGKLFFKGILDKRITLREGMIRETHQKLFVENVNFATCVWLKP